MALTTPAKIVVFINGKKYGTDGCGPTYPLVDFIRNVANLKGTKSSCEYGCSGSCTVVLSEWDRESQHYSHRTISSCTTPLASCHYRNITTVEGIGTTENLHPIQKLMVDTHAVQCGYDSPGIVVSMLGLLLNNNQPTMKDIEKSLIGNISRCNGYRAIFQAFKQFTERQSNEKEEFESKLPDLKQDVLEPVTFISADCKWSILPSFSWLKPMQMREPDGVLVYGIPSTTELKECTYVFDLSRAENSKKQMKGSIDFPANTTISALIKKLGQAADKENGLVLTEVCRALEGVKTLQYRNARSIGDALVDCNEVKSIMAAVDATISIQESAHCKLKKLFGSEVTIPIKKILSEADMRFSSIKCVSIANIKKNNLFLHETVADRQANGSNLNFASALLTVQGKKVIESLELCAGNRSKVKVLHTASSIVKGSEMDAAGLVGKLKELTTDKLQAGLIAKLCHEFGNLAGLNEDERVDYYKARIGTRKFAESTQFRECVSEKIETPTPLGRNLPTMQGYQCTTGQAIFTEDLPQYANELFFAPVTSTIVHGNIKSINADSALEVDGVKDFLSFKDIRQGGNQFKINGLEDEIVFVEKLVEHEGQLIGGVVAINEHIARKAAALVKIDYEELTSIVTLEDAVINKTIMTGEGQVKCFEKGEAEAALATSQHVISGSIKTTRQEHFYEETVSALVVPTGEHNEIEVYIPTPAMLMAQHSIAQVLGLSFHQVMVHTRRVGCSYGGKYGRLIPFAAAIAVAAKKLGQPVRSRLTRDEDIRIMGQRGEFGSTYKIGVTDGKIQAAVVDLQKNAGWNSDASPDITATALAHLDSGYDFPNLKCSGEAYKTNTPSNTAFRAYGAPPAVTITENMIFDVCAELGYDQMEFRKNNLQKEGYISHYEHPQAAEDVTMDLCLEEVLKQVDYYKIKQEVEEFNSKNTVKKRGIACIPNKYGIGFPGMFGKGAALLNIYMDGSVLLHVNGIEMGQGLHTKCAQIAAHVLGIDISRIKVDANQNRVLPNPIPTGGSTGTDLAGNAVNDACVQMMEKLAPYKKAQPEAPWEMLVGMAFVSGTNLSTSGHYQLPADRYTFDPTTGKGRRWWYYTCGASFVMVEVDLLTGQHSLLKANIVYDIGESLNNAIDCGQIEAAFIQGYGYLTMEDTAFDREGRLTTRGHDEYSIPSIADCPPEFDVTLLRGNKQLEGVLYSSKGIGEPPFFSGQTVYFAIKDALVAAKKAKGKTGTVNLLTPSTPINVLAALEQC
jgi:xanthine dehydrogenase/oxidase